MPATSCPDCGVIAGPPGIVISARQKGAHLFHTVFYSFLTICFQWCPADIQLAASFQHLVHLLVDVFWKYCSVPAAALETRGNEEWHRVFRSSWMGLDGDFVDRRSCAVIRAKYRRPSHSYVISMTCPPCVRAVTSRCNGSDTQLPSRPVHVC